MNDEEQYEAYLVEQASVEDEEKRKGDDDYQHWLMAKMEDPSVMERIGRGFNDMGQGVKQAYLALTDKQAHDEYTAQVNEELRIYNQGRGEDAGFDFARLGGQMAAAAPAGLGMMGRTVAGKAAIGGGIGGVEGGMMFSPEGAFSGDKAMNVGAGAVGGAAFGVAVPAVGKMVSGLYKKLTGSIGREGADAVARGVGDAMNQAGIKLEDMSAETVRRITASVDESLRAGVDPESAARKAVMESVGMTGDAAPTRAQTSKDPEMWTKEQELAKLEGGEPLNQRYQNQSGRFREITDEMDQGMGGMAVDDVSAAHSVSDNILTQWEVSQKEVSKLYKAANASAEGAETTLDSFGSKIDELANLGYEETIPQLKMAMSQIRRNGMNGEGEMINVNANVMEEMKIALQSGWKNLDGKQRMVVRELVESLNDDMDKMGNPFKEARAAGAERFQRFGNDLVQSVVNGKVASKNFISTKIIGGDPKDIGELKVVLNELDPQAWQDIRGRAFGFFMKKAYQGNPNSETGEFSGKMLAKALHNRDSVLRSIFEPEEMDMLHNLARTGEWMKSARPNSNVNYSNTASTLLRSLQQVGRVLPIQRMTEGGQRAGRAVGARAAMSPMPNAPQMSPATGVFESTMKGAGIPVLPAFMEEQQ